MRIIYASTMLCTVWLFASCGGSTEKETSANTEKKDVEQLVKQYCNCITTAAVTDSCANMMLKDALSLASDKEALASYNTQTDVCTDQRMEQDMKKVLDKLDEKIDEEID